MPVRNGKKVTSFPGLYVRSKNASADAVIELATVSSAPTTASGYHYLYVDSSNRLVYDNGTATTILGAAGAATTTWDGLYANDTTLAVSGAGLVWTVSANVTGLNINKSATGAGGVLQLDNAGTGDDFTINTTRGGSTGVVMEVHHDSGTPADNDVLFELEVNGDDDGGTETEYASLQFRSTDVTDTTEDADFLVNLMLAGTQRTCLQVAGDLLTLGSGTANEVITSNGAYDLILETNAGTNSGTIRIYDGASGNIEIDCNGTGDLTLPSTGIVQGGTAATRCTFAVAGTTGVGFSITNSTITSGDVVRINHSASATLDGGNILSLQIDGTAYYTFSETALTVVGTGGSNVFVVSAGDLVVSDGSLAITDADDAASFSVTNNTATTASVIVIAGSGVFTGSTTTSFATLTPSGLTTGTVLYVPCAALTTGKIIDIVSASATDASFITLTGNTANQTTTGKMINIDLVANVLAQGLKIATTGIYTGTAGLVDLDVGAMTTGVMLALTSTTGLTSGSLIRATTSTAGAIATNGAYSFVGTGDFTVGAVGLGMFHVAANSTLAGTVASISGTGLTTGVALHIASTGTGITSGSLLRMTSATTGAVATNGIVSIRATGAYTSTSNVGLLDVQASSTTAGTIVNVVGDGLTTGTAFRVAGSGVYTGSAFIDITQSGATSGTVIAVTCATVDSGSVMTVAANALTTGTALSLSHTTSVIAAGGSVARITSTSIDTSTTTGCILDLASTGSLAGTQVLVTASALTTGKIMRMVANALTSGMMLDLESSAAGFTGSYIRCYDGAAVDFSVAADGIVTITSTASDTTTLVLTNDFATTVGAAANDGVINLSADGLTTGTALNIGLTEGTLTTGRYIKCWDVTGGVEVWSVEEDGEMSVAGGRATTAGGADAINIGASAAIKVLWGSGVPTATAPQGSLYLRTDGSSTSTRVYINTNGATTWTACTTAA